MNLSLHSCLCSAALAAVILGFISCSGNFDQVPQTGFVTHHVKNTDKKVPFEVYWDNHDAATWNARVKGEGGKNQLVAVAPVDISHMNVQPATAEGKQSLSQLAEHFQKSVRQNFDKTTATNPHFRMVPPGTKDAYTLELAIISITPTNARAGAFVTAMSFVKGGGLVKLFVKKGHIAIAGRLKDQQGRLVSEFAAYEEDHASVLGVDVKNFEKYGHHKHNIDEWSREIADVYSSTYDHKTRKRMITLNPLRAR